MIPMMFLAIPQVVQAHTPTWEESKDQLDKLLHEKGGVGLLISIEQKVGGELIYREIERGGSDSAWKLELLPIDPSSGQPGPGAEVNRGGGFTVQLMKPIEKKLPLPIEGKQILIRFRTEKFKGLAKTVQIPGVGAGPIVQIIHLPAQ